jgi:hypothetical protein
MKSLWVLMAAVLISVGASGCKMCYSWQLGRDRPQPAGCVPMTQGAPCGTCEPACQACPPCEQPCPCCQ